MNKPVPRVPVLVCLAAGWVFLVVKAHRLAVRLVLPASLLLLLQVSGLTPQAVFYSGAGSDLAVLVTFGLHLFATALVTASAYRVAVGEDHRFVLARLEIGPDEVRILAAKIAGWTLFFVLLLGASLMSGQVLSIMEGLGVITATSAQVPPDEFQWFKDIETVAPVVIIAPLALFGLVLAWLGTRYALVFAATTATRRFALFSFLTLTKNNSWRIAALWLLAAATVMAAVKVPLILLGWLPFETAWLTQADWSQIAILASALDFGPPLDLAAQVAAATSPTAGMAEPIFNSAAGQTAREIPAWAGPALVVAGNVLWQIVFAGALARAYAAVSPSTVARFG